jgi:glycosyltransferase involved in cell wall biosynthesis
MRILLPYFTRNNIEITDSVVIGGIERFAQLIYQNFDDVVPVHFTDEDRKKRRVTDKILAAIESHEPDVVIVNYDNAPLTTRLQARTNTPILWITHTGAGGISKIGHMQQMHEFQSKGGIVAFVSEHQHLGMDKLSQRIESKPLPIEDFINSAFSSGDEKVLEREYDAVTVGRTDKTKNPFWMPKKLNGSGLHNIVLTQNVSELLYGEHAKYYEDNLHWEYPNEVVRGLSYEATMTRMAQAGCYVSTCPAETWGITALEALAHGLPTILVTNTTDSHASELIPVINNHITKVRTTVKGDELAEIVRKMNKLSFAERLEISELTKEKHSLSAWKKNIENIVDKTIECVIIDNTDEASLQSFFV